MYRKYKTTRWIALLLSVAAISICLASCKKKEEAPAPASRSAAAERYVQNQQGPAAAGTKGEVAPQTNRRKVILNHSIALEVKEFKSTLEALSKLAESSGGYVFKSNSNGHDRKSHWGEVSIRVPVAKAGSVMTGIRGLGNVERENSSAEDITEGYVDLEARLKNAKASEARLLELNHKAGKISEILEIEKELSRVRGEIESFEAKKKNWDVLTEMVTIDVSIHEVSGGMPSFSRLGDLIVNGFGSAIEGLIDSLSFLIIFLSAVLPWAAVFGPLAYIYMRYRRKMLLNRGLRGANITTRQHESDEGDRQ